MPENISGFGVSLLIIASNTFPVGITLTQFADDADPIDMPALTISGNAMGLNGDKANWTSANPLPTSTSLITGSDDDRNMQLLFEANRAGKNKSSAKDILTAIISYPDGSKTTLTGGSPDEFMPSKSIASEGRFKSNTYTMSFENRVDVPAV